MRWLQALHNVLSGKVMTACGKRGAGNFTNMLVCSLVIVNIAIENCIDERKRQHSHNT